jgi:hypothetical protein
MICASDEVRFALLAIAESHVLVRNRTRNNLLNSGARCVRQLFPSSRIEALDGLN